MDQAASLGVHHGVRGGGGERGCFGGIRAGSEHERTETKRGGGNIKTLP